MRALRGVDALTAVTTLAELGDLTRFDSPRQLMAFVGVVPCEHSSGSRQKRGAITKAGNAHVRRVLVEAAPGSSTGRGLIRRRPSSWSHALPQLACDSRLSRLATGRRPGEQPWRSRHLSRRRARNAKR